MDFITRLPSKQARDYIYVVVDRLNGYAHFFAIPSRSSTSQVAELFFQEVFRLHGLSNTIVNDRDSQVLGGFQQELFRLMGTKITPSMSYHPHTDG